MLLIGGGSVFQALMDEFTQGTCTEMGVEPIDKDCQAAIAGVFLQTLQVFHRTVPLLGATH
jgi:hypothetical protein